MAVYADVGRLPLYIFKLKIYIINYLLRVCHLQDDSMLVKKAYLMMTGLDNMGFNTWVTNVRNILTECTVIIYNECTSRQDDAITVLLNEVKECMYAKFQKH